MRMLRHWTFPLRVKQKLRQNVAFQSLYHFLLKSSKKRVQPQKFSRNWGGKKKRLKKPRLHNGCRLRIRANKSRYGFQWWRNATKWGLLDVLQVCPGKSERFIGRNSNNFFYPEVVFSSGKKGDHRVYWKDGIKRPIIVPRDTELPPGIILNNLRTLGASRDEYIDFISGL